MFCFNCGTKLVENAKFCSACGTAMQVTTGQPVQFQQSTAPVMVQAPQQEVELFNLLGHEIEVPKATGVYGSIRNEFHRLATEAMNGMTQNFNTKYKSLDDLIRHGDNDTDYYYNKAIDHGVEILRSRGNQNIDLNHFFQTALEYAGHWDANFSQVRERFRDLIQYKKERNADRPKPNAHKKYRLKENSKIFGGKEYVLEEKYSVTSDTLQLFKALAVAATTSMEVSNLKTKIFKDPGTRNTLCGSIFYDIFYIHLAVIECLNNSELLLAAEAYSSREREKARNSYNNVINGNVDQIDLRHTIVEILKRDPFIIDYYVLALKYTSDEFKEGLIDFGRYCQFQIDELIQTRNVEIEYSKRLAKVFGHSVIVLEHKLQNNRIFQELKTDLAEDPFRGVQKVFFSNNNDMWKTKVFLILNDSRDSLVKKLENATKSYARIHDEKPLLLFDNTVFGSAKDGLLLTDKRIYVKNTMAKGWSKSLHEIQEVKLLDAKVLINGEFLDVNGYFGKEKEKLFEVIEFFIYLFKCNGRIGAREEHLSSLPDHSQPVKDIDYVIENIKNTVLSIPNNTIRKYVFVENENDIVIEKFQIAINFYAKIDWNERAIILFEFRGFGKEKNGFVITNRKIFIKNTMQKPVVIDLENILSVAVKGSNIMINQIPIIVSGMFSSSEREELKHYIEDIIYKLK